MSIDHPLNEELLFRCPNCRGQGSFYSFDTDDDTECLTCGGEGHVLARYYDGINNQLVEQEEALRQYRANQLRKDKK